MKKNLLLSEALESRQLLAPCTSAILEGIQTTVNCPDVTVSFANSTLTVLAANTTDITPSASGLSLEIVTAGPNKFSANLAGDLTLTSNVGGKAQSAFQLSCTGEIPVDGSGRHFSNFTTSAVLDQFPSLYGKLNVTASGTAQSDIAATTDQILTAAQIGGGFLAQLAWSLCPDFIAPLANNTLTLAASVITSTTADAPGIAASTALGSIQWQIDGSNTPTINCPVVNVKQLNETGKSNWANTFNNA